jgi:hypothetical protein
MRPRSDVRLNSGRQSALKTDLVTLTLLLAMAVVVTALIIGDAAAYIRGDWPTMFLPPYAFLGEQIRVFNVPGWNPYQFSGAPFAGDPSSGWGYLPAMLVFALLPLMPAITVFIGLHIVLSAVAAYVLARLTDLGPGGAFVAGAAYAFPWLVPAAAGMVLFTQVTTWLPIALIGVELARLSGSAARRFAGLALSGLAISQILASWLGQGSYYALLVIGGWVAWRTLVTPHSDWSPRARLIGLVGIGGSIVLIGFGLNAAALLVRLEANTRTNLAGGVYTGLSGWAATNIGVPLEEIVPALIGGFGRASWQYVGATGVALALLAPLVALRWPSLLFWFLVAAAAIVLTLPERTPLHMGMYALLPRFETIHSHLPERVLLTMPLAVAMLAGATADALGRNVHGTRWRQLLALLVTLALAGAAIALERQAMLSWGSMMAALAILVIAAIAIALPVAWRPLLLPLALALVIVWDPAGRVLAAGWGPDLGPERSLRSAVSGDAEAFLYRNGAAAYLTAATRETPSRYAGYDPALLPDIVAEGDRPSQAYRNHWRGPANWLLVHNWGTWFELEDIQGYNPIQLQRYVEYIDALNGHHQEYHERDLFPAGLTSPLLDLLNLRYLLVPADAPQRADLAPLLEELPTVYTDAHVRILENRKALPRVWLVHDAQQVAPGEALPLLAAGTVDPRQTALLETALPELSVPADPAAETAIVVAHEPDRVELRVTTQAPALLVLSEVWDPGWRATVSGVPTPVLVANHALRALLIPPGEHPVVLTYDPPLLRLGLAITLLTVLAIIVVWGGLVFRGRKSPRPAP